jgi:SAM-dependent methyltransferase
MDRKLKSVAKKVYNYHNLGVGLFPQGEEKTPYGSGERYNFDRMYMLVSSYDFTGKAVVDLGCNSGWFCLQTKLLGARAAVGIDYEGTGLMGEAIRYAMMLEKRLKLGMTFLNENLEHVDFRAAAKRGGSDGFDAALVLSVLHHIHDKRGLFERLYEATSEVVFYEDHEFWNQLVDDDGQPLELKGEGYRYGWNEDLTWQRRMGSFEQHAGLILDAYRQSWRHEDLLLDRWADVQVLGLSEKRRPVLALLK